MKNLRFLTKTCFRQLALMLCLAASIPQIQALDFYFTGSVTTWDRNNLLNDNYKMINSNGEWTWSYTATSNGDIFFRMLGRDNNYWYNDGLGASYDGASVTTSYQSCTWTNNNAWKLSVEAGKTYTFYLKDNNGYQIKYSVASAPSTPHYYVTGDSGLGLGGFTCNPSQELTDSDNDGIYTYTTTATATGQYGFILANGKNSDWNIFNNNYRIGPTDGNVNVTLNGSFQQTQLAGGDHGSYRVAVAPGTVTFHFNPTDMTFKVTGTAPTTYDYTFYVLLSNGGTPNLYLWDSNQNKLNGDWPGTAMSETEILDDGKTWYKFTGSYITQQINAIVNLGNNANQSDDITGLAPGTYYITWDGGNHTTANVSTTPPTPATIYIEGSEGLGLQWGFAPTTTMTYDPDTKWYTYTCTVEKDGTYGFFFADGQGADWDSFNAQYRIGPQSGNQAIALNNWVGTQLAHTDGGSYQINCAAGQVTIYFNPATMQFKVDATAPTYQYTFYIYPSDGATTPHIYLWDNATPENIYTHAFPGNEVTVTEVLADGRTWYKYSTTILVDVLNAIVSGGGNNADNTKTKNITNFEPGTYYIVWDPVRANGDEYNHFELYNNPPSAVGDHKLFIHGGYYHGGQTFSYTSDTGSELKYDGNTGNYYINNITLSSNATFCFTTLLGENWQSVGTRYGNGGTAHTDNPNGTNYLEVTPAMINTYMPLNEWSETYGEYKMSTAGVYNIIANPTQGWVKLIKTDHKNLSPMNVYLEQTGNVEIDNIMTPGTTYTTAMFDGYWPLSAYNQEQGGWDPNSDSQHYPVTYMGDTTTVDGKKWWHWQVSASIAEVFFTRTNKEPFQSETIHRRAGVMWYTWDEENGQTVMTDHTREYFEAAANALPSNAVVIEGHYYVYFINTLGWDRVFCYAWENGDGLYTDGYNRILENWPGHVCEPVGIDPVTGYEVWRYDLGTISSIEEAPDGILFNDGDPNALSDNKEQTGDFEYINGGVYDYLGLFDGAYTLNNLIRTAAKEVRYTVSNDLLAVYYDPNAVTTIEYQNEYGEDTSEDIKGALYAKDLNQYGEKSVMPNDDVTDYVYQTCGSNHTPGRSQIMIKKTTYDQSNWVKLVMSPNYDGGNPEPVDKNERPNLAQYVGHIIPAGTLDVFMTDTVNPTAHVLDIKMGETMSYEPNVYISAHFNDTVVFNYTHRDWQPKDKNGNPAYKGNYRTKPVVTWNYTYDEQGNVSGVSGGTVTRERVVKEPYYMYYVAPKPQELAYITWVVYDNYNVPTQWQGYVHGEYHPYTSANGSDTPPSDPGRFYGPMNWDRSIQLTANDYNNMKNLSTTEIEEYLSQGAHSSDYGPYSNGYMQYGGIKVNWSLFDNEGNGGPWWQIFKPGQAYKFLAIIRYARGSGETNSGNNCCYQPSIGYYVKDQDTAPYQDPGTVFSAPRRDQEAPSGYINMYFSSYDDLDQSKFIIFPIKASASNSRGDEIGNVTEVKEVIAEVNVPRDIVSVNYYNLMGVESDKPFDGINIVVTTYSDGTRTSRKILR